ncbi:MAG: tetratricopeptide repeat protein [Actinobacteria bacterium]|nr:tetratricopeptide repeat protein [Actinomycetota bacterium]
MHDLRGFREAVREHRRAVGRTQQQLARSVGLHPDVLSHKLNGRDNALLTTPDVIGIATTLAAWGALVSRSDVYELLGLMEVPPHAIPAGAWSVPPLDALRADQDGVPGRPVSRGPASPAPAAPPPAAPSPDEPAGTAPAVTRGASAARPRLAPVPLPAPATPLIGRERERAGVAAAVAASRLVTLTGVGGTGKTRLALQVAEDLAGDFADGVAFIDLASVRDSALLATAVARALGLAPVSAEAAEAHLAEALQDRELLLVVDNLEHLLDETRWLARLLAAVPALRLLVTSRIPLRLYGEHTVRVPPLPLSGPDGTGPVTADSEAVQLFIARARAIRPDFGGDADERAAVGQICAALDGLPLAIELAAARVRLYSPQALLPLLRSRLALLTGGPRDLPRRQQTLRAALDWSHDLLSPTTRRLFARLGVFAGPFDAAAAAAVSAEPDQVATLEQLADLADQSLLEVSAGQTPGFRMLQTVREYALARLAETGEQDAVQRRHLAHFLTVAHAAAQDLDGPGQAELLDRLEGAYPDMRAALEFAWQQAEDDSACLADGLRLAAALNMLWQRRGSLAEGVLQLDRLLALDDALHRPSPPRVRASAVLAACTLACFQGNYPRTVELARHGLELCASQGDHEGLARAHRFLGEVALGTGDYAAAEPHFERELAEASQAGHVPWQAHAYNMLGQTARLQGEFRRASSLFWQALKLFRAAGHRDGVSVILASLGETARDAGRPAKARRLYGAALRRHAAFGNKRYLAYELEGFAAAAGLERAGRQALVYLGAAQVLREETGGPLPAVERAILERILEPAVTALSARERQEALSQGRDQPLPVTIAQALSQVPRPGPASSPASPGALTTAGHHPGEAN